MSAARYDFHSHTYLTDGQTSAADMWRAAEILDHRALAITDHVGHEDAEPILSRLLAEAGVWQDSPLRPVVGVELSMVRPERIADAARQARRRGAEIVIVHGETPAEAVWPGTNHAALASGEVDLLAHPGLLTDADAELARANGVVLELSARRGHSLANGHVASVALRAGCEMVVDSDAHRPEELVSLGWARTIARGAGVPEPTLDSVLAATPQRLLRRLAGRR